MYAYLYVCVCVMIGLTVVCGAAGGVIPAALGGPDAAGRHHIHAQAPAGFRPHPTLLWKPWWGGGAVSYERGTPVCPARYTRRT